MGTCLSIATPGPSGRERNGSRTAATKHTNKAKKKVLKTAEETKGSNTARNTTPKSSTAAAGRNRKQNQIREGLRVASWNVDTKNRNFEEKKRIICKTIRKNRLDLIGFQELAEANDAELKAMRDHLNNCECKKKTGVEWSCAGTGEDHTGQGFGCSEYVGFLWCNRPGSPKLTMNGGNLVSYNNFTRRPFVGDFQVDGLEFAVVNVHLKAQETGKKKENARLKLLDEISMLVDLIKKPDAHVGRIILLGDFNIDVATDDVFQDLIAAGYTNLIPAGECTNFINTKQYDNIWVRKDQWGYDDESHNEGSVIRDYCDGNNDKPVSDHCPVWAFIPYYRNTTV